MPISVVLAQEEVPNCLEALRLVKARVGRVARDKPSAAVLGVGLAGMMNALYQAFRLCG